MSRPWTGRAPLKKGKKTGVSGGLPRVIPEFDSFVAPRKKRGVKGVQPPGPFGEGEGPRYVRTREEVLGAPLTREEVDEMVMDCNKGRRQVNLGRDGLIHNMLELIHTHWKRRRCVKVKCKGVPTVDMDNVCQVVEDKTGGRIIKRQGGTLYVFRGRNYNYRLRPRLPLMLWKPPAPIYPKLVQDAPGGLTLRQAQEMRRIGRKIKPLCKLAKNGVYHRLVGVVRAGFEEADLVRVDCRGLNKSDYKKIGAKLRDLVPCILLSFDKEHILMWRGADSQQPSSEASPEASFEASSEANLGPSFTDSDSNPNGMGSQAVVDSADAATQPLPAVVGTTAGAAAAAAENAVGGGGRRDGSSSGDSGREGEWDDNDSASASARSQSHGVSPSHEGDVGVGCEWRDPVGPFSSTTAAGGDAGYDEFEELWEKATKAGEIIPLNGSNSETP
ncbi:hypothetical protein CLOP_g871 [Closterium sp. NIES-67]|nr:hypothetical protein CLOP_g871 [Closterium sp. NIES-67]